MERLGKSLKIKSRPQRPIFTAKETARAVFFCKCCNVSQQYAIFMRHGIAKPVSKISEAFEKSLMVI